MHTDKAKAVKLHGELRDTAGEWVKHRKGSATKICPCSTLLCPHGTDPSCKEREVTNNCAKTHSSLSHGVSRNLPGARPLLALRAADRLHLGGTRRSQPAQGSSCRRAAARSHSRTQPGMLGTAPAPQVLAADCFLLHRSGVCPARSPAELTPTRICSLWAVGAAPN